MRVGFVGLGSQGAPMARRIAEAGLPLTLWARRPETLASFADAGVEFAPDLPSLAKTCDVLGVCVVDDADVVEVLAGPGKLLAGLAPGAVVLIHSTVHPDTCRGLADEAAGRGVIVLDAPVSGGEAAAQIGELAVMVGGDEAAFERCRPVLETYGKLILRFGGVGAGQMAKLVNNALFTAHLALAADAVARGRALGLDAEALVQALLAGSGRSVALESLARRGSYEGFDWAARLLRKDVDILTGLAAQAGAPGLLEQVAQESVRRMEARTGDA